MTNTTQCPNCSSIFVISDEQYSASKGKVRCGSCREKFKVVFLADNDGLVFNPDSISLSNSAAASSTKPRSELLRILSEHADREEIADLEEPFFDKSFTEITEDIETPKETELKDNFNSTLNIEFEDNEPVSMSFSESAYFPNSLSTETPSKDLPFASDAQLSESGTSVIEQFSQTFTLSDEDLLPQELIDEVDSLIHNKILGNEFSQQDSNDLADEPFSLTPSWPSRFMHAGALLTIMSIALILLCLLTYQLWLKQMLPAPLTRPLAALQEILDPVTGNVFDKTGYALPVRKDLSNLQLLSAKTEAHPSRASTILLRVSFLNRAKIEQPLPALELSLSDEDGRLISRRSFQADDYLYNNATDNQISSNELKKVTIELLAFPRHAHGYELKMINQ